MWFGEERWHGLGLRLAALKMFTIPTMRPMLPLRAARDWERRRVRPEGRAVVTCLSKFAFGLNIESLIDRFVVHPPLWLETRPRPDTCGIIGGVRWPASTRCISSGTGSAVFGSDCVPQHFDNPLLLAGLDAREHRK